MLSIFFICTIDGGPAHNQTIKSSFSHVLASVTATDHEIFFRWGNISQQLSIDKLLTNLYFTTTVNRQTVTVQFGGQSHPMKTMRLLQHKDPLYWYVFKNIWIRAWFWLSFGYGPTMVQIFKNTKHQNFIVYPFHNKPVWSCK